MRTRTLLVLISLVAAGIITSVASAVSVSVRVEGKTQSLFGPTAPRIDVESNALDALASASLLGEFYYHVATTSFGLYVDQIGLFPAAGSSGWVFKINGASSPVGADSATLRSGDSVLWYWANFDPVTFAGPKTLFLRRDKSNCYTVFAEDDRGAHTPAAGALLHVGDKRSVTTSSGRACVGRHRGLLVRATLSGAIRSNALR